MEALIDLGPGKRNLETYVVYNGEMAGILEDGDEVGWFSRAALADLGRVDKQCGIIHRPSNVALRGVR
jgi:hypothetical protein